MGCENYATRAEIPKKELKKYQVQLPSGYKAWILNRHVVNSRMPILSSVDSSVMEIHHSVLQTVC